LDPKTTGTTKAGSLTKGIQVTSYMTSAVAVGGATAAVVASTSGMLKKQHKMDDIIKNAN
jgi:hypothetical protein